MLPESLKKYLENNDFDNFPISLMDIKYPILMSYEDNHEIHVLYITKFKRLKNNQITLLLSQVMKRLLMFYKKINL